jgi:hypothetical protein
MKFNPYVVLLTTGLLMCATVVWSSFQPPARVLVADDPPEADVARHPDTMVASVEKKAVARDEGRVLEE